jgi:hypothetical protein
MADHLDALCTGKEAHACTDRARATCSASRERRWQVTRSWESRPPQRQKVARPCFDPAVPKELSSTSPGPMGAAVAGVPSMNMIVCTLTGLLLLAVAPAFSQTANPSPQEAVRERSADVMPFEMDATTHIFTKTREGGVQRVVVKSPGDTKQTVLIRRHLKDIADRFGRGDFGAPTVVHGAEMPGLAALKAAVPGELHVRYRDLPTGAEIQYSSRDPKLVSALHEWFDAQVADHGTDAMAGHDHGSMQ